jgi:hypothetical protein
MTISEEIARLAELHRTGAMSDEEFVRAKERVLAGDTEREPEDTGSKFSESKTLLGRLWNGLVLASIGGAIVGLLGYVLLLEQTARFVAPVACRGEYSAGYDVDRLVTTDVRGRVEDVYMACVSEAGERQEVRGPVIFGTLFVEATAILLAVYVLVFRKHVFKSDKDPIPT